LTIGEPGGYEICDVCFWEDDPVQSKNIDLSGGANDVSLKEARANYQSFGAISMEKLKKKRPPLP
jgi:hypothetical protein